MTVLLLATKELINKLNFLEDEDRETHPAMLANPFDEPEDHLPEANHLNPFGDPDEDGMWSEIPLRVLYSETSLFLGIRDQAPMTRLCE